MKNPVVKTNGQAKLAAKQSLAFQQVIMGMRLDETMPSTLKYVNFLSRILPFKKVTFLHVSPYFHQNILPYLGNPITGYPLGGIYANSLWKLDEQQLDDLEKELKATVNNVWQKQPETELNYILSEGSPVEKLIEKANEAAADLVIVGKNADTRRHQINAKNIIRQTTANVLLVPENAEPVLEKILVPFDFSENSIRALKFAVAIKEWMPTPVIVQVLNVYQEPYFAPHTINQSAAKFRKNIESSHREAFDNFFAEKLPEIQKEIHPITLLQGNKNIAYYLMQKAKAYKTDLIIMGAKGHSKLELLLMGSTTERLVNRNNSIPTLVVK